MITYIPTATGQTVPDEVERSIRSQSIFTGLVVCSTDGIIKSNHGQIQQVDRAKKFACEGRSRNACLEAARLQGDEFFAISDRDLLQLYNSNFQTALDIMKRWDKIGVVHFAIEDGLQSVHPRNHCCIFRLDAIKKLKYEEVEKEGCHCDSQELQILAAGYRVEWTGNKKLCHELLGV